MKEITKMHCTNITADTPTLSKEEINTYLDSLPDWQLYEKDGEPRIEKTYKLKDFNQALYFANLIGRLADEEDHHPAILTEWGKVTVDWWTHKIKGLHLNDFIMAAKTEKTYRDVSLEYGLFINKNTGGKPRPS